MADEKTKRGPQDRSRINLNEDYELLYWTKEFGVSEDMLRDTVHLYGNSVDAVRKALKDGRR
jgi:hypothetical protein